MTTPNIPDESVPVGRRRETTTSRCAGGALLGSSTSSPRLTGTWDRSLGAIDFERGVKLAKSRFVVLGQNGARLNRALINFMLDTHGANGLRRVVAAGAGQHRDAHRYRSAAQVRGRPLQDGEGLYLIPTAEVQLTNLHRDEVLEADDAAAALLLATRRAFARRPARLAETRAA